mgnify:FL=1
MSVGKQVRHHTWFALKYYFKCKKMIVLGGVGSRFRISAVITLNKMELKTEK